MSTPRSASPLRRDMEGREIRLERFIRQASGYGRRWTATQLALASCFRHDQLEYERRTLTPPRPVKRLPLPPPREYGPFF